MSAPLRATTLLLLAGCACAPAPAATAGGAVHAGATAAEAVQVEAASARLMPSGVGAVYLRVRNPGGSADRLLEAASPAARLVELHEVVRDGEVLRMVPRPEGFEVPAGGTLELAPSGRHLMLFGLTVPADATQVRLTLRFARAGPVEVVVPVRSLAEELP